MQLVRAGNARESCVALLNGVAEVRFGFTHPVIVVVGLMSAMGR